MSHHFLPDGTPLWYEALGAGRPLVLLQSLQFPSGYFWSRNLEALTRENRVILLDLRGQGLSGKPNKGHSIAENAADFEHFLQALSISDALLFGAAFGGLIALQYLQDFGSHRLRGLGLCEMTPRLTNALGWAHPTFGDYPEAAAAGYGDLVRADRGTLVGFLQSAFAEPLDPDTLSGMLAQMYLTPTDIVAELIDDMARMDFRKMVAGINLPTLLIYGRKNNPVMPGHVGRWLAAQIPSAELVELDGGGHTIFWEDPLAFNEALSAFAAKV